METLTMNWYALYVRSRHEFVTESELKRKGIETYLPYLQKLRQWKDRKKLVEFPIFPGYLFVRVRPHPEDIVNVLHTKGAVTILSSERGHPLSIPPEELNSLRLMIESGNEIDIYPDLREGMPVRIKRGALTGAVGILEKKDDQYTFRVCIQLLGRSIGIKVYANDIDAA